MKLIRYLLLPFLIIAAAAQIPAFPGAEGYGAYAKGGRGGDVYHVTNLNTSGVGSFADAIATVPALGRTIVFDVSGHIHINKTTLSKSNVTIAGQTAPADGIGFKDRTFIISGDDIVIRHARFRYGDKPAGGDCIDLSSGTLSAILDQGSIEFSTDETISSFSSPPGNLRSKALEKALPQTSNGLPNFSLYLDNCLHDADGDGLLNGTNKGYGIASGSYNTNATPFAGSPAGVTIDAPLLAKIRLNGGSSNSMYGSPAVSINLGGGSSQLMNRNGSASTPFDLAAIGNIVRLTVTGDPATLTWTGAASANWDTATANNWTGASPNNLGSNDAVIIDDSSAVTNISRSAPVTPRSTLVNNTTRPFTIAGGINGGSLTKSGNQSLTLGGANTFAGGLTLNAGTIILDTANNAGLGTGPVTLNSGVISMHDDDNTHNAFTANLVVPAGATARLNADARVDMYGSLSGAGTLNFYAPWVRTTLFANWSAFSGIINVLTDAAGGDFRLGTSYGFPGFPQAAVALTNKVWAYYTGTLAGGVSTSQNGVTTILGSPTERTFTDPAATSSKYFYRIKVTP